MTTKERSDVKPNAQASGQAKQSNGFQQLIFGALSRKTLAPSSVFVRRSRPAVDQGAVEPIISERDQQTGRGATAVWWSGSKNVMGRAPGKTGASSFQRYQRVIGEPGQCRASLARQSRPGDHKLMEEIRQAERRCSRKAARGWTKCAQHGLGRRDRGQLVELLPEAVPVLICDR